MSEDAPFRQRPLCLVVELFRYHERDRPVESRTPVSINQTVVLPATSGGFKYHLRAVICGDKRHWWAFVRYGAHSVTGSAPMTHALTARS